eukprot:GDKK01067881.1.p1 GENE.GDKK01067881.1~~GDKK01067881.1.p1  ORF type:complete len:386 (+),score=74.60 GDKK01067881.1:124-1281(+)
MRPTFIKKEKSSNEMGLLPHEKAPRDPPRFEKGKYEINWVSTGIIMVPPLLVLGAILYGVPFEWKTMIVFLAFYLINGLGITAGYHRLFSHRSYNATRPLQTLMAFCGAGAFQGSVKWWARNHRIHHNYIDTDKDPYNAHRGFVYSHLGWMVMKQDYEILGRVDISDLNANKMLRFQHDNYFPMALMSGIILPTLICGLGWGDWAGGYFYAALLKMVMIHHGTFCINSLAHTSLFGAKQQYSEEHSSHDSVICALVTFGEGYHNFHHEFSQDFRNGLKWFDYDPTKWTILLFNYLGMAKNLVRTPDHIIAHNFYGVRKDQSKRVYDDAVSRLQVIETKTAVPADAQWTWDEIARRCEAGAKLMVIGKYVIDIERKLPLGSVSGTH